MKRTGRQSIIVWCLVVIFFISLLSIPLFAGISLKQEYDKGIDLLQLNNLCEMKK